MNHHFQRYPHGAPGIVFMDPGTPVTPICPPGFAPTTQICPPGFAPTTPICPPGFAPTFSPHRHGPLLPPSHPVAPLVYGPSTLDQVASHLGLSAAESRSLSLLHSGDRTADQFLTPLEFDGTALPAHMSQAEHEWLLFSSQPWVHSGGLEPLDSRGRSVLHEWLERPGPQLYICNVPVQGRPCGTQHNRQDRALTHVRKHLNARPYECNGKCGNPACQDTFAAPAYLKAHAAPVTKPCRFCGHGFLRQNVKRHEENCRMRHEADCRMRHEADCRMRHEADYRMCHEADHRMR